MNDMMEFAYEGKSVRTVQREGATWWVLKDVCDALGIENPSDVARRLDDEEKAGFNLNTLDLIEGIRGNPNVTIVNESGLYNVILRSDKPEAKAFKKWVTGEVLPSIRKHGAYITKEALATAMADPRNLATLLTNLAEEREAREKLEKQHKIDAPKVLFADVVSASSDTISVGMLAKFLKQHGMKIGRNRLYERLRDDGWVMKGGNDKNIPTQKSMERGLMEMTERSWFDKNGLPRLEPTTFVTSKGQQFFIAQYCPAQEQLVM